MKHILAGVMLVALSGCMTRVTFPVPTASIGVTPASYSKEDCKKGGWQSLRRAEGGGFKNQGDCVSYFSAGK